MATSSPTTADIKVTLGERMTAILKAGLTRTAYDEYSRLEEMLGIIAAAEHLCRESPVCAEIAATTSPAIPSQNDHVKTYRSSPTARERVRAYLAKHGPSRTRDIIRDTRVPAGTLSGLLNAASTEFASPSRGVWKLKNGK